MHLLPTKEGFWIGLLVAEIRPFIFSLLDYATLLMITLLICTWGDSTVEPYTYVEPFTFPGYEIKPGSITNTSKQCKEVRGAIFKNQSPPPQCNIVHQFLSSVMSNGMWKPSLDGHTIVVIYYSICVVVAIAFFFIYIWPWFRKAKPASSSRDSGTWSATQVEAPAHFHTVQL